MRSLRWLLLAAILVLTAGLFGIYRNQRTVSRRSERATPPSLATGILGDAVNYEWAQSADGRPAVKISAEHSTLRDNNRTELEKVELRLYTKDAKHYDRVRSLKAEFSTGDNKLVAPGEAEITLGVPAEGELPQTLTTIKAAGINFDSQSGQAVTTQPVAFTFAGGDGVCVGAEYNPENHQLHLQGGVSLYLRGKTPGAQPMKVEAGELTYNEAEGIIQLGPWSKLTKGDTLMTAAASTVHLKEKELDFVEAAQITGHDKRPGRELEYSAPAARIQYTADREIEKLNGTGGARLTTKGNGASTTMAGQSVDLFFNTQTGESELSSAIAKGAAKIESVPTVGDSKILQSETLNLFMKPGGKDVDRVNAPAAAVVEFVPSVANRHKRILRSSDMDIRYGPKNVIQAFHANNAVTETFPTVAENGANAKAKRPPLPVSRTSSRVLDAVFDENAEIRSMKQSGDFRYDQGSRKAQANSGSLDNEKDLMVLDGNARFADESGSTAGDYIEIKQESGEFDAKGHVQTTRLPEAKKTGDVTAGSDMLDKDEPTQGLADRVISANRNQMIHYIGNAVLWQASNRIQADRIDIDRATRSLVATDKVISQFQDKKKPGVAGVPIATVVRAQKLVYTDKDRQAAYTGGVAFRRGNMAVDSADLTAFLNDEKSGAESRIHHAIADGKVNITKVMPGRRKTGRSEHAEYYTEEGKITLSGGEPTLEDTVRGNSQGDTITYYTEDERLLVDGVPGKPVRSLLRKKKP
ncbi:MAG: OstA family protein [Bryobacterales bacterium]|nr:OstA family protein [Bryobacterales bacterium]